jgi:hypothetical protein
MFLVFFPVMPQKNILNCAIHLFVKSVGVLHPRSVIRKHLHILWYYRSSPYWYREA